MILVSAIVPTYNRFKYLLNTIKSIKEQTYENIEIIIVNDCSTQKEYYEYDWDKEGVTMIHLEHNSRDKFGYTCAAYVRNQGIAISKGDYIAFCDDDDIWFPYKIELQLIGMKDTDCKISATEGLIRNGDYNKKYNSEYFYKTLQNIYRDKNSDLLERGFPEIWTLDFLKIYNCVICSSVLIEKNILNKINNFKTMRPPGEDYDCWLRALHYTKLFYVNKPLCYYDIDHGDGQNY